MPTPSNLGTSQDVPSSSCFSPEAPITYDHTVKQRLVEDKIAEIWHKTILVDSLRSSILIQYCPSRDSLLRCTTSLRVGEKSCNACRNLVGISLVSTRS